MVSAPSILDSSSDSDESESDGTFPKILGITFPPSPAHGKPQPKPAPAKRSVPASPLKPVSTDIEGAIHAHPLGDLETSWLAEDDEEGPAHMLTDDEDAPAVGIEDIELATSDPEPAEAEAAEPFVPPPPMAPGVAGLLPLSDDDDGEGVDEGFEDADLRLLTDAASESRLEDDFHGMIETTSDRSVRRLVKQEARGRRELDLEASLGHPDLDLDGLIARLETGQTPMRPVAPHTVLPPAASLFDDFSSAVGGGAAASKSSLFGGPASTAEEDAFYSQDAYKRRMERRARTQALKTPSSLVGGFPGDEAPEPAAERPFEESIATLLQLSQQLRRDRESESSAQPRAAAGESIESSEGPVRLNLSSATAVASASATRTTPPRPGTATDRPRAIDRFIGGSGSAGKASSASSAAAARPNAPPESSEDEEDDWRAARTRIKSGRPSRPAPNSKPLPAAAQQPLPPIVDRALLESLVQDVLSHPRKARELRKVHKGGPGMEQRAPAAAEPTGAPSMTEEEAAVGREFDAMAARIRDRNEAREAAVDLEARRLGVSKMI